MLRIVILFTNCGPYHLARLQAFEKSCNTLQWQLNIIELFQKESQYPWSKPENTLSVQSIKSDDTTWHSRLAAIPACISTIRSLKPNVIIIPGYGSLCLIAATLFGQLSRIPMVLMSESKADDSQRNPLMEAVKGFIIKKFKAALVGGEKHKNYLVSLGMSAEAIFKGYDVVGNDSFAPSVIRQLPRPITRNFFLTVSRFVKRKNLHFLIDAYADYCSQTKDQRYDLVICGAGPQKDELENHIHQVFLDKKIHLLEFLPIRELLRYYAHASCLIHASTQEQWGLVVNEAMAAGLPVLVSSKCGCVDDLVVDGINGYTFDPNNHAELTQLMLKITAGDFDLAAMGEHSLKLISAFTPQTFADNLAKAVEHAASNLT